MPSVVGMLQYLCGHSRPDLGFAVSQVSRFTFDPKRSHEEALIRIGQYLKGTMNEGLILKPHADLTSLEMDAHVDSDFMGLYGTEKKDDPDSVRSRTGYVIRVNKCPIVWCSKLEHSITTSTMMAEYYALSTAMREVLPLRDLVSTVAKGLGFDSECQTTFKTKVCEDNMGCLTLAQLEPGHNTPRSRFYDNKVHWFRQHVYDSNGRITVERCDTKNMIADTFTKACVKDTFEYLRKLLMGW